MNVDEAIDELRPVDVAVMKSLCQWWASVDELMPFAVRPVIDFPTTVPQLVGSLRRLRRLGLALYRPPTEFDSVPEWASTELGDEVIDRLT